MVKKDNIKVIISTPKSTLPSYKNVFANLLSHGTIHIAKDINQLIQLNLDDNESQYTILIDSTIYPYSWINIDQVNMTLETLFKTINNLYMSESEILSQKNIKCYIKKTNTIYYGKIHNFYIFETSYLKNLGAHVLSLFFVNNEQFIESLITMGHTRLDHDVVGNCIINLVDNSSVGKLFDRITKNLLNGIVHNSDVLFELLHKFKIYTTEQCINIFCTLFCYSQVQITENTKKNITYIINLSTQTNWDDNNILNITKNDHLAFYSFVSACIAVDKTQNISDYLKLDNSISLLEKSPSVVLVYWMSYKGNVFESYAYYFYENLLKNNINCYIFLVGESINGPLTHKFNNNDIFMGNVLQLSSFIETKKINKMLLLYLPRSLCSTTDQNILFEISKKNGTDIYIYMGGTITFMHEYVIEYPNQIQKILTMGTWLKKQYEMLKLKTQVYPTFMYSCVKFIEPLIYKSKSNLSKKYLYAGRFTAEKRIDFLIDGFARFLVEQQDPEYQLYIIGSSIPSIENPIIKKVIDMKLDGNIKMIKWLPQQDLHELLRSVDYNITVSITEGLSGIVLEAQKLGIPSIASNVHCIDDVVTNNYNGILFDYEGYDIINDGLHFNIQKLEASIKANDSINMSNFVSALNKTAGNLDLCNKLGFNCIEYMNNIYNPKNALDVLDFFDLDIDINKAC